MNETTKNKPLTEQERQTQPLPNEVDPKDARMRAFLAAQKTKNKFKIKK